ncbi:putative nuclear pore protein [Rosellinia necatrix]|uniref:Putative nuclear pore protein n=1 Tax=Rosellinia necatrix TaxID=77044 RepID=A0A1W2TSD7_ROSNE|nr:putative nuclear pore protein [Rosellinia necatrix]
MASPEAPPSSDEAMEAIRTIPRALTPIPESEPGHESAAIIFHPDADLEVIVQTPGGESSAYMVCASALACASPIWRSMLYFGSAYAQGANDEPKQDQVQTMRLNGNLEAIGLLFRIIHYEFSYVPKEPTLDQLFELGKSVCHFKCAHLLYPWANQWASRLINFAAETYCYRECHKALHVAWVFGELNLFRETVDALIVSAKINHNRKIVNSSGQLLEDMLMPRDIFDLIIKTRACTIAEMLNIIKTPIRVLSSEAHSQPSQYCKVNKDSQECEAMMLGSAIRALTKAELFPVPEPESFIDSIECLKEKLDGIRLMPYIGKEWAPHISHEKCNLGFCKSVEDTLKKMTVPLSASVMRWMSDQAKTCGIEATSELEEWRQISKEAALAPHDKSDPRNKMRTRAEDKGDDCNTVKGSKEC